MQVVVKGVKMRPLPKGKEMWMLNFEEITDRDVSEMLLGYRLLMRAAERERLQVSTHATLQHHKLLTHMLCFASLHFLLC
jgi:hypothetical protein